MKTSMTRLTLLACCCAALVAWPAASQAQSTGKPAVNDKASSTSPDAGKTEKSAKAGPFHGKLAAVDKVAKTITVGKRTFRITSESKLKKGGKPATLDDGVVGETVSGYVKPAPDGKLVATTVNFGPKPAPQEGDKSKASADKEKPPKQPQAQ